MEDRFKRKQAMAELKERTEAALAEVDWKTLLDRDIQRVADEAIDPEHRENVIRLIERYRSQIRRGTESPSAILNFLEDAAEEGLIPAEWIDADTCTQSYVRIGDPAHWREELEQAGHSLRALPATWDEATTIVMRSEQMRYTRDEAARDAAQSLNPFLRKPIGTHARWLVLGPRVLEARMDDIEKADGGYRETPAPSLESIWALIEQRRQAGDDAQLPLAEPTGPPSVFTPDGRHLIATATQSDPDGALIDDWLADMGNTVAIEIMNHPAHEELFSTALAMLEDIWHRHADKATEGTAIEEWREKNYLGFKNYFALAVAQAPFDVRRTLEETYPDDRRAIAVLRKLNPDIVSGKRFSDFRNPFYPILLTWLSGVPLVASSEHGQTFVLPSAGIVEEIRGKKKYDA